MAIGQLTQVSKWARTVVVPVSWFQGVQDNINGFIAGADSVLGLTVDGSGGNAFTPEAGHIYVGGLKPSSNITITGNDAAGTVSYTGSGITAGNIIFTFGYAVQRQTTPVVIISPASALASVGIAYPDNQNVTATSGFNLVAQTTFTGGSGLYAWNYVVIGTNG